MSTIPIEERNRLCEEFGLDSRYLYQLLTGRRELEPARAVRLEQQSGGRLRRWHLRAKTWHLIWPELVGVEGAPCVPSIGAGEEGLEHGQTVAPAAGEVHPNGQAAVV
ncbi:hypothetical protein [Roseateles asaccharophilus]|uniref:DNA-binding transcriptional regulator YdaS (Cro superfamily) n=1 Tax=Roseateles asaccharophilus TaxID=582607 RepID=A0ABU2A3I2_9BURK|nr:hypothetical protein [Roseateles asaccharophilus]MDR7331744.1 DNA-binding transcriptional regulator YdaS (Cro superfamily) [Roseateles asaccharophilus]